MFTEAQKKHLITAMDMYIKSNKRMQTARPEFHQVFHEIDAQLTELMALIKSSKIKV